MFKIMLINNNIIFKNFIKFTLNQLLQKLFECLIFKIIFNL